MTAENKKSAVARVEHFLRKGQWRVRANELSFMARVGLLALRMVSLVTLGFRRHQCSLHAASLTFFSMMALVPVLVLALAMARTFGGAGLAKEQLDQQLDTWMAQMEQSVQESVTGDQAADKHAHAEVTQAFSKQVREISDQLFEQVNRINFGTLGGVGLVMLMWTVIGVLGKVESSFNQVWGVSRPRPLLQKCAYYLFMIMILPFLSTAASTVPVARMVIETMDRTVGGPTAETLRALLNSGLFRAGVTWTLGSLTFAFLLGIMPNARVKVAPALVGGFVTTILFGAWVKLCAMLQIGIAKYSALYGGFATLPILLMWVFTSWQIILLGEEIVFAIQHRDTFMIGRVSEDASPRARLLLALAFCTEAARRSCDKGAGPLSVECFGVKYGVASSFVREVAERLSLRGLLAEVAGRPGEYLLCRCGSTVTAAEIAHALFDDGESPEELGLDRLDVAVVAAGRKLNEALDASLGTPLAQL